MFLKEQPSQLTEAALFHIDESVSASPKARYSCSLPEQGPLPASAALQFLGKWLGGACKPEVNMCG